MSEERSAEIAALTEQRDRAMAALHGAIAAMKETVRRMERWTEQKLPPNGGHYSHHELDGAIHAGLAALDTRLNRGERLNMKTEPERLLDTGIDKPITEIWAWVVDDPRGGEAVAGGLRAGLAYPLLGADRERVESYRSIAQALHNATDYPVKLVKFSTREIIEVLE